MLEFLSPQLQVFFYSMLPYTELRASIPIGLTFLHLPPWQVYWLALVGNIVPAIILVALLEKVAEWSCKHSKTCQRFFTKLYEKTQNKHSKKFQKYGPLFLILFVAVPLPGSGAWMGSIVASLFKVNYFKAVFLISAGLAISGLIVLGGFTSILNAINLSQGAIVAP